jgi:uncharacterized membrane protein
MIFPLIKLIHILSATLMIGTGFGSAFYLFLTYKKGKVSTVKDVLKLVILADTIFTTPSVILQLVTGIILTEMLGLTFGNWFWQVMGISLIIFILWVRAAFIQLKLRKIIEMENEITEEFHRLMRIWFYLGVPSFLGSMLIYYLMVFKVTF